MRFVDITGIVKGASQGEGLGNKFLAHIREVDAVAHVVRCFRDDNVVNVMNDLNPGEAADIIETELLLADLQQCQKAVDRYKKPAKSGDKDAISKCDILERALAGLNEGKSIRPQGFAPEEVHEFQFLTSKPILYVVNVDEGTPDPKLLAPIQARAAKKKRRLLFYAQNLKPRSFSFRPNAQPITNPPASPLRGSLLSPKPVEPSGTRLLLRQVRRKPAPGSFRKEPRQSRRPGKSTATSNAVSSVPRFINMTIWSKTVHTKNSRKKLGHFGRERVHHERRRCGIFPFQRLKMSSKKSVLV